MNNYHIYEEIGRGKYSVVYKGRKKKSIEYVIVKSVERSRRKKLMDEVAIFNMIENDHIMQGQSQSATTPANWHPNILRFYNWYETRNHYWIILEYCSGGDLQTMIEKDKKLPEEVVKKFAHELLEGLSYLHSQGIIFGDLKPANVLLNEFSRLKLCDFGLAKKVTDLVNLEGSAEERASNHSSANQSAKNKAGTPYYMAPELFQDNGVYSYFSDFWSLGCMLYEMATGKPPFYTNSLKDLIQQILVQDIPAIQKFSPEFNDLLRNLLKKDPIERMNWEEIKRHPWWTTPCAGVRELDPKEESGVVQYYNYLKKAKYHFTKRIYQPQLHFEKYLINVRKIDPKQYYKARADQLTPGGFAHQLKNDSSQQEVDPLRISYTVVKNMQMEEARNKQVQQQLENEASEIQAKRTGAYSRGGKGNEEESKDDDKYSHPFSVFGQQKGQRQEGDSRSALSSTNEGASRRNEEGQFQQSNPQRVKDKWDEIGDTNLKDGGQPGAMGKEHIGLKQKQEKQIDFYKTQQSSNSKRSGYAGNYRQQTADPPKVVGDSGSAKPQKQMPLHRDDSSQQLDKYDYNLGKNKKMVLDFTNQEQAMKQPTGDVSSKTSQRAGQQQQQFMYPSKKSSSPLPNKTAYQTQYDFSKGASQKLHREQTQHKMPSNQLFQKQASTPQQPHDTQPMFSQGGSKTQFQKTYQTKSQSPNEKLKHAEYPQQKPIQPQRVQTASIYGRQPEKPKEFAQNLFKTQATMGQPMDARKKSPEPAHRQQTSTSKKMGGMDSSTKQSSNTPLLQNYDKLKFLNDQFDDFEEMDDVGDESNQDEINIQGKTQYSENAGWNGQQSSDPQLKTHIPMNPAQAMQTIKVAKDMTLFTTELSKQQIKDEIQTLVRQTVQIGPVQQQANNDQRGLSQTQNVQGRVGGLDMEQQAHDMSRTQPTQMRVPHKSIEQLIIHTSDTSVKPIVGNKEIERIQEEKYDEQYLKFVPWSSDEVIAKINTTQIENHLSDVYKSIAGNDSLIEEKIAALQYFESIIVNSNVSNQLINSAFMSLLKKMLESIKVSEIKIRVCSVVGLLIRHSTIIDNELAEIDIASQLIHTLKDSNEMVRRRAIAALGEYMFYAATQLDDEMADPVWELSEDAINIIVYSLDEHEPDRGVRFYACKTLENICAQSTSAGHRFATEETVQHVLSIFLMEVKDVSEFQNEQDYEAYMLWFEGVRISAATALSHICKLNPMLFPQIFESITPNLFCETLMHGNGQSRVQQAFITMLNLALHNIEYPEINQILLQEKSFLLALKKLLEHQHIVIRGKSILTFLLLIKQDYRWMIPMQQEIKFFNQLEKLLQDNYKYVQCCLLSLADGIQEVVPLIFKTLFTQLHVLLESSKQSYSSHLQAVQQTDDPTNLTFIRNAMSEYGDFSDISASPLYQITILLDMQINPLIRSRLLSSPMIQGLATMLDLVDTNSFKGAPVYLNALLIMTEKLSTNYRLLEILAQPVLSLLAPVLFDKLKNSDAEDVKFMAFKIFTDMMVQYIGDPAIYQNPPLRQASNSHSPEAICRMIVQQHLLPNIQFILSEQCADPIPFFGLRLLSTLAEKSQDPEAFCSDLKESVGDGIVPILSNFFQANHPKLNKHTLVLMQLLVDQHFISLPALKEHRILEKTHELIVSMVNNQQEWCLEKMIEILHSLLTHLNHQIKADEAVIKWHIDEIFENFDVCIQLFAPQKYDVDLVEKATQCMIQMLQLYAQSSMKDKEIFFMESHLPFLISALKSDKPIILKRVLKCVYWAFIQTEYVLQMTPRLFQEIEEEISKFLTFQDRSIAATSREIHKLLETAKQNGGRIMLPQQMTEQQQSNVRNPQSRTSSNSISQGAPSSSSSYKQQYQ